MHAKMESPTFQNPRSRKAPPRARGDVTGTPSAPDPGTPTTVSRTPARKAQGGTATGAWAIDDAVFPPPRGEREDRPTYSPGLGARSTMTLSWEARIGPRTLTQCHENETSWYGTLGMLAACLAVLASALFSGCSGFSHAQAVDPARARAALKVALDHWKSGEDPKSLQSSSMPMTAQDFEWTAGAKLLDYQILDEGKEEDANLRVQVKLTLKQQGKTKALEKNASYVVGTSPSVTVFRDMLRR